MLGIQLEVDSDPLGPLKEGQVVGVTVGHELGYTVLPVQLEQDAGCDGHAVGITVGHELGYTVALEQPPEEIGGQLVGHAEQEQPEDGD